MTKNIHTVKIAVCDDLPQERCTLVSILNEYCAANELTAEFSEFDSGEALLSEFTPGVFALVFLDIYMDGISGVDTARQLKGISPDCVIIFTTTSREHGAEAFETDAFHYLVKPIDKGKLFSVMSKWYDNLCDIKTIDLKCGRAVQSVYVSDILYAEVHGRTSTVNTQYCTVETSMSLSALEALLPPGQFCRPIRYCIVSMRHIRSIGDDDILLDTGKRLAMSRLEKENIRSQLADFRLKQLRRR